MGNLGGGAANAVTFANVDVPTAGVYQLEIDYATKGARVLQMSLNGAMAQDLVLDGSSFDDPVATVLEVRLLTGRNTLRFGNAIGFAPDLDRVVVAPRPVLARLGATSRACPAEPVR